MMSYKDAADKIAALARDYIEAHYRDIVGEFSVDTKGDVLRRCLQIAWANSIRADWEAIVLRSPGGKAKLEVTKKKIMDEHLGHNLIINFPGIEAQVCKVDGENAVCVEAAMDMVYPLSAFYFRRVSEACVTADLVHAVELNQNLTEAEVSQSEQSERTHTPHTPRSS